jgi:hypothetical protein
VNGYLAALLAIVSGIAIAAVGELISEEVRDRLDQVPRGILRLAARRLDPGQRATVYRDEWEPELTYILGGTEARPVTRLITGSWYAFGILLNARRIARHLHRPAPGQPAAADAPGPSAGHVGVLIPRVASPGLVDIAGPLNLVASPSLYERMTARWDHARDGRLPDVQRLIDYLVCDLRLMGRGEGVPARLLETAPGRGKALLLYTTGYVLTAFETSYRDAYTIAAIRPINDCDRQGLARGALRLRPTTWSYYSELPSLPRRGNSRWSVINAEWGHLHSGDAAGGDQPGRARVVP